MCAPKRCGLAELICKRQDAVVAVVVVGRVPANHVPGRRRTPHLALAAAVDAVSGAAGHARRDVGVRRAPAPAAVVAVLERLLLVRPPRLPLPINQGGDVDARTGDQTKQNEDVKATEGKEIKCKSNATSSENEDLL